MDWQDTGTVLTARRHGETSAIIEVFTAEHGRHAGVVRGGTSRKIAPILQPGAQLCVNDCALNPERDMYEQQQASLYEQQRQQQLQEKQQMKAEMEALVNQKK